MYLDIAEAFSQVFIATTLLLLAVEIFKFTQHRDIEAVRFRDRGIAKDHDLEHLIIGALGLVGALSGAGFAMLVVVADAWGVAGEAREWMAVGVSLSRGVTIMAGILLFAHVRKENDPSHSFYMTRTLPD